ncbi:protein-export chaperone SecB [Emticicia sp. 17c]|uniref:protein-export chaperone SecB n=1 Tax=Emticicia sp. 17c TaxID=3127704 RepID=UPI00301B818D
MENNQEFELLELILIESTFSRKGEVSFASPEYQNNISIDREHHFDTPNLYVTLKIGINSGVGGEDEATFNVHMLGIFRKNPEINNIGLESFAKINAPAIIFPFIREHIASLSSKARLPLLLLPPLNFVKIVEDSEKQELVTK